MAGAWRSSLIDLRPLRQSPAFARMWLGGAFAGVGGQITLVAVMLHVWALTGSTLAVSLVAFYALVPMVLAGLYGGMLADAFDRRIVAVVASSITWVSTAVLAALTWTGFEAVWLLYLLSIVNAAANTVVGAARQSIVPRLLPRLLLPAAAALGAISMGIAFTAGPAIAGVLVASLGFAWTYTIDVILHSVAFLGLWTLPGIVPEGERRRPGLASLVDGWRFLRRAPNIRMQFVLDIVAMTFGQPMALYPAVGALLLGGGAVTVGALTSAFAVGSLLGSLFSGPLGRVHRHGVGIQRAVVVYGAAILLFGGVLALAALGVGAPAEVSETSANLTLIAAAALCLAAAGAADNASAIFRTTMMQSAVPDAMRGRLQGVFMVVVAGGPRVGALYVGLLVGVTALWFPPLLGGVAIMVLATLLVRLSPRFRDYDARDPQP